MKTREVVFYSEGDKMAGYIFRMIIRMGRNGRVLLQTLDGQDLTWYIPPCSPGR